MPETAFFSDTLILLLAAIVVVPVLQRLRVPPILGYLAAGLIIGPYGLRLVQDLDAVEIVAEFGIVFLLFSIGLDLPLSRLKAMRRFIFGLGIAQVAATTALIMLAAYLAGLGAEAALVVGGGLAMSSTATVLRVLSDSRETATRVGRVAIAVLLFQDLAVVPLLVLLPLLQGEATSIPAALAVALGKAAIAIAIIFLLGRLVVRPAYRFIAATGNAEVFTAASLFLVLAVGLATAQAGMSMALGAFLAGLLLADTAYRNQVEADIGPFRGLFLGLFFMTIGMSIDLPAIGDTAVVVAGIAFALLAAKAVLLLALCRAFGLALPSALRVGLLLAQGGEFGFIVFGNAVGRGFLEPGEAQVLIAAVTLSLAATPVLAAIGRRLAERLDERWGVERFGAETSDIRQHVIIAGFGRVGQAVAQVLSAHDIPYVALELNLLRVGEGRARGLPVYFGDASNIGVLRTAGVERASAAVLTMNRPEAARLAAESLRRADPRLRIIARAHDLRAGKALEAAGATAVVPEIMEACLQLAGLTLRAHGVDEEAVDRSLDAFRADDYARLEIARAEGA